MCCKQSFITKGFFKRHDKNRGFPSLSLKRANIQLAGIYLADNHIRSPFAFAYIFCWQIIIGIISLLLCFVNSFMRVFLKTPPSRRLFHLAAVLIRNKSTLYLQFPRHGSECYSYAVSPVGSVGASACGRGLHRRPAPHSI